MSFVIHANTPAEAITEIVDHLRRESSNLHRQSALTTGHARRDLLAQGRLADRLVRFFGELEIEPLP